MARHSGENGKVKMGGTFVGHVTNWSLNEKAMIHDQSAAEDGWDVGEAGRKNWSGSVTLRLDHAPSANQTARAGDEIALELYSEGDGSGRTYYSGTGIIEDHGVSSPYDNTTERTYSFKGNGELAIAAVA